MNQKVLLTITMLVSDRTETIEKCMCSLKSILEKVPSELIVVDTAQNEICLEVVRQYTDKIIPFTWCNDFAKARNTGLKEAKGQWVMFLDDDEWFESTEEIEEFFLSGIYKKYNSASYVIRNYINQEGTKWDDRIIIRVCRNEVNVCFKGKIHEYLSPVYGPTYRLNDYVHHYGYVYKNEEEKNEHAYRNIIPLIEERRKYPKDFHIAAQLVQEYLAIGENYSAIEVVKNVNNLRERYFLGEEKYAAYTQVMEIRLYMNMYKYQIAYERGKEILSDRKILLLTRGCISGLMVGICALLKKYEESIVYVDQYLKAEEEWRKGEECYQDPFNMERQFLNLEEARRMQLVKLNLHIKLQQWKKAEEWFNQIQWKKPWSCMIKDTARDIIKILLHSKEEDIRKTSYKDALEAALKYKNLKKILYEEIDELDTKEKEKVLTFISLLEIDDIDMLHYHLEYYFLVDDKEKVEKLLEFMREKGISFICEDPLYWKCLDTMNIEISQYIQNITIKEYFTKVNKLYIKFNLEVCKVLNRVLWKNINEEDIKYKYVKGLFLEKQLLQEYDQMEEEKIGGYFSAISGYWLSCAMDLYRTEVFQGELFSALPSRYQFAWYIANAEKHREDISIFSKNIAAAGKSYLPLSKYAVRYLHYIQEEKKKQLQRENISPEMQVLAEQIKEKVRELIRLNKLGEAMQVVKQLETFVPDDEELYQLKSIVQKGLE